MPDLTFQNFLRTGFERPRPQGIRVMPQAGTNLIELVRWLSRRTTLPNFETGDQLVDYVEAWLASPATRSAARALWGQYRGWAHKRGGRRAA